MGLMDTGNNKKSKMITFTNLAGYPNNMFRLDYYEDFELVDSKIFNFSDSGLIWHFVKGVRTSDACLLYSAATRVFNICGPNAYDGYNGFRGNGAILVNIDWSVWPNTMIHAVQLVEE